MRPSASPTGSLGGRVAARRAVAVDFIRKSNIYGPVVRTIITSKGQTTVPVEFRKRWKTSDVIWDACPDGSARVHPSPDVMKLYGAAAGSKPRDPNEIDKARAALARAAAKR